MTAQHPRCCFIVNPKSAGGRTRREWEKLRPTVEAALGEVRVLYTDAVGSAIHLCRQALDDGYKLIVSVGGDGTNNEVINGFFEEDGSLRQSDAQFTFFPRGSGGDLRRTLPHAKDIHQLIALIKHGNVRHIDVGRVTFEGADGHEAKRFFLNITSIGVSGEVNQRVNRSRKLFGGTAAFFLASTQAILTFKNPTFQFQIDDGPTFEKKCHLVIVANGRYFGGGMMAAPNAEVDDGLFDLILVGDYSKASLLMNGHKLYKGTHIDMPDTTVQRVRKLRLECDREIWLDIDGEVPGHTPATLEIVPQVLPIRLP